MKKFLNLFCFMSLFNALFAQQTDLGMPSTPTILRQSLMGAKWIYTSLDAAVAAAEPNDILYLSGGTFHLSAPLNKKVTLLGTGYRADSARLIRKTEIIRDFILGAGSGNASFGAIHFNSIVKTANPIPETVYFSRCRITGFQTSHLAQFQLQSCVVGYAHLNGASALTAANTVFEKLLSSQNGYLTVENSIFLGYGDAQAQNDHVVRQFASTEITNSIILLKNPSFLQGGTPNGIRRNLFVGESSRLSALDGDTSNVLQPFRYRNSVFVQLHDTFEELSDYHLKPESNLYSNRGIYNGVVPHANPPVQIVEGVLLQQGQNTLQLKVKLRTNE